MFNDYSAFDAFEWLAFVLPLLGTPVLIIVALIVESPVLRREPTTARRRTAATVLAIISLIVAAPLLLMIGLMGLFGWLLLAGLAVPAVLTLVRLRQHPAGPRTPEAPHGP